MLCQPFTEIICKPVTCVFSLSLDGACVAGGEGEPHRAPLRIAPHCPAQRRSPSGGPRSLRAGAGEGGSLPPARGRSAPAPRSPSQPRRAGAARRAAAAPGRGESRRCRRRPRCDGPRGQRDPRPSPVPLSAPVAAGPRSPPAVPALAFPGPAAAVRTANEGGSPAAAGAVPARPSEPPPGPAPHRPPAPTRTPTPARPRCGAEGRGAERGCLRTGAANPRSL